MQNFAGRRYLVPVSSLVLAGEAAERSWSVYLTPEQAAASADLNLGYQSAIVVAPESSHLRLLINNSSVINENIQSSESVSEHTAAIPAGVLRAGYNLITLQAAQRHRTDCGIPSTYELWTEIDQATTYLTFADAAATTLTRVDDIRAIGVDDTGQTSFNMVVPAADQSTSTGSLIRLAEGLAIMAGMPNQTFNISRTAVPPAEPGQINVVVGTANEVRTVMGSVPSGADVAPIATFVDDPQLGTSTLVITGPSWQSLATAVETISAPTDRPASVTRSALVTQTWRSPDAPLLLSAARLKFSEMGTKTQQFSGRRFRTDFTVGVPSDFYADSYGEATILLDAAYSGEVLPGSHIDIYVNDNIAATLPITTRGGEILRHLPISVTMRHFRPGANTIAIEAVLMTRADEVCAPGASTSETNRFVLFDTSEFVMPNYARIGQRPNLGAVAGTAFPYGRTVDPIPVIIDHTELATLSATTTLLARMSVAAGRSIPVDLSVTAENVGDRSAIFVSPISQLPPAIMSQAGIAEASRVNWGTALPGTGDSGPSTDATFAEWRERLSGQGWRGQISSLEDWLNRNFDISLDSLRLRPRAAIDYVPSSDATLLVAQSGSPNGEGTWTVVTAPNPQNLGDGMRLLVSQSNWAQIGGHITIFNAATSQVDTVPVNMFSFVETQPGSFTNYRLIVSNWLSANILSYSGLLAIFCVVLGLVTAAMLATMGRRR
ncbi:cellulose biosynthesis cyclic di-GMP-binding regulatory protein BcsB [Mesorhizobium sp. SB112]|uniref:cellulose biosynthesis cyclic di-GMP-binding regulatory protein BcsB n=1 Tax=Mesorhizobium sp. SB112 TaxID=3151853 RepID=UPI0032670590